MKFFARCAETEHEIDVGTDRTGVFLNGDPRKASLTHLRGNLYSLSLDHQVMTLSIVKREGELIVSNGVWHSVVSVEDDMRHTLSALIFENEDSCKGGSVVAPMPGLIERLLVQEREEVATGQGLLIIEAMKMENEIRSPFKGTVKQIRIREKQSVEKGTVLIVIE
jgi:pyruvate carboxylase subunit B